MNLREGNDHFELSSNQIVKKPLKLRIKEFFKNPKKRLIFIIVMGVVLIGVFALGLYFLTHDIYDDKQSKKDSQEDKEVLYEAPLDGIMTDKDSSERYPLAIMIENHTDARPQSGINKSSIVYEAIAEGGITRFMAIFGTFESDRVGPVRSARPYFIDWLLGYNAYYAHVGGNINALDQIKSDGVLDLNQFTYPNSYWRDTSLNVSSEHTMQTSTIKLREEASKQNYSTSRNFSVYRFNDDPKPDSDEFNLLPKSQKITVDFSSANYKVDFEYNKDKNEYLRSEGGKPHIDRVSSEQLTAKNIVVMTVQRSPIVTRINEHGWQMETVGSGKAKIFVNGKEYDGTWKKSSKKSREIFYDTGGNEITFSRGRLWICVIPPEATVNVETIPSEIPQTPSSQE